jgi:predicted DNA binding CopG/RHH family protein
MNSARLTKSEASIEKAALKVKPYPKSHPIYSKLRSAAINTTQSKAISLRLNQKTLTEIKQRAEISGIPYQTLINVVLNQYVRGEYKPVL